MFAESFEKRAVLKWLKGILALKDGRNIVKQVGNQSKYMKALENAAKKEIPKKKVEGV